MKFSTRATYGLRAIINLAKHFNESNLALSVIAMEEAISLKYLETLFANLKKAGLVKSIKGAGGGYKLAKPARQITVYEIINALEGKMSLFHCLDKLGKVYCKKNCTCSATMALVKIQELIMKTLKNLRLSKLL
ncbi:Rrf2 family transcriptional regulator [Patescibacteria group bacterium]|nr:Rrf2 family transcriptional regulator [Patescibacteria group bacterium]MBU1663651.1 Rrf2 family transcriptional regulator [Patescibacteria group bacterium]MBU1934218.1 Rrf2 family transcriptional regulator [Patescibacteria group bacterium]MBU2007943.1 Rrf2 family transcriptional regulator [Patescibacteria group bacterium]MBU2233286.1 Rrf2 family transcriptional regulator [Patescibacteria group bacterium]